MIQPLLSHDAFLADVYEAGSFADLEFRLWWLGQSGFLLQWQNRHLLLDPYLSDSLTKKYAATDKPHVRLTELVIAPDRLDFINTVTSSHNHTDHLDPETLVPLLRANPNLEMIIPEANREFVCDRLQIPTDIPIGLDAGKTAAAGGFVFHGVPAAHELIEKDQDGRGKFLGYVIQFGGWTVYHSGDTILYPGMAETLRAWPIDVALLPINGVVPERRVAGNLDGREAATLAKEIGARLVIPCHFEMFEFNTSTPDLFMKTAEELGQPFRVLHAGERWCSTELG